MTFRINGQTWTMSYMDSDSSKLNPGGDDIYLGLTEYSKQRIRIRTGMSKQLTRSTVSHELCHMFLFVYGFGTSITFGEEEVCNFIGAHLDHIKDLTDEFMEKETT